MKKKMIPLAVMAWLFGVIKVQAQGYIVPNGVVTNFISGEISVLHDPTNNFYTGFVLRPQGGDTFRFDPVVDIGVRVFFVSSNDPVSLQPILAHTYTELLNPNNYVFPNGSPLYVGLYTGNDQFAPPNGIYNDPLFGWAELVNNQGVIQLLDSALEYKGGGIYAGTETIIGVPEPTAFVLAVFGGGGMLMSLNKGRCFRARRPLA